MAEYEGDRYKVDENDGYQVIRHLKFHETELTPVSLPTYCILDEEDGGYIAFITDEGQANYICDILNRTKLFGVRYRFVDSRTTEDFLYPLSFTSEENAQAWINGHPTASSYMSVETLTLNPSVGVL